jgi:hypothetical protein
LLHSSARHPIKRPRPCGRDWLLGLCVVRRDGDLLGVNRLRLVDKIQVCNGELNIRRFFLNRTPIERVLLSRLIWHRQRRRGRAVFAVLLFDLRTHLFEAFTPVNHLHHVTRDGKPLLSDPPLNRPASLSLRSTSNSRLLGSQIAKMVKTRRKSK